MRIVTAFKEYHTNWFKIGRKTIRIDYTCAKMGNLIGLNNYIINLN